MAGRGAWTFVLAFVVAPLPARAQFTKAQRAAADDMTPGALDLTPALAAKGEARVLKIRIYADNDYRNIVLRWQMKARAQVGRLNAIVQPVFNVRFEVDSLKDWNETHVGVPMPAVLDRLRALDPATDVDLIVAFTTPLSGVATSIHAIGQAALLTRHFIMRGMDDEQEALALDRELYMLSTEERRTLCNDRKGHKEMVIFLHEWGHTLGLLHNEEPTNIMNPRYDARQSRFSEYAKQVITLVVHKRIANRSEARPEIADLLPLLEAAPADEGSDAARAELLALARRLARGGGDPGKSAAGAREVDLSAADIDAFNRTLEQLKARQPTAAWTLLAPVLERARKRHDVGARTWARLAGLAAAAGALTAAEDAIARAGGIPEAQAVATDVAAMRRHVCLPHDAANPGVDPGNEPAYVAGYWDVLRGVSSLQPPAARERLSAFEAKYPGARGSDMLACDLELRAKRLPAASKRCEAAVVNCKGSARAHYLMGVVAANGGKQAAAQASLEKAITIDPSDEGPWLLLARIYRRTHSKQRLVELEARHKTLLSTPLPKD